MCTFDYARSLATGGPDLCRVARVLIYIVEHVFKGRMYFRGSEIDYITLREFVFLFMIKRLFVFIRILHYRYRNCIVIQIVTNIKFFSKETVQS